MSQSPIKKANSESAGLHVIGSDTDVSFASSGQV